MDSGPSHTEVFIFYPHGSPSSSGGHGGSRVCSAERRLKIYPHGVWIHTKPVVMATGIKPEVSPRNPSLIYSAISF
jgi:hypothetical protein